ncbi:MAG: hypothetical protein KF861_08750 [Planctomycetaceae bacterium]|nr:hypothetical protein [Planctomycetaceae bacterium]
MSQTEANILEQLEEKDQLIQTLTERLSEVAEQLDRAQRSGSDRGGRSSAPGVSGELLEQQRNLLEGLSAAVDLWDGLQPRDAFRRIEARLDHMRSLLESFVDSDGRPAVDDQEEKTPAPAPAPAGARAPAPASAPSSRGEAPRQAGQAASKPQAATGWEAMKAQLLSGTPVSTPATPSSPPQREVSPSEEAPPAMPAVSSPSESSGQLGSDVTLPEPVDFECADRETLEQAIEVRDHFIGILTRKLRAEQHRTRQTVDWAALNNAPEELKAKLQTLEADLEDRHRIAEVELSLERARLSRVESRIEDMQRQVEARFKNAWPQGQAAAPGSKAAAQNDDAAIRSWFNTLRRR